MAPGNGRIDGVNSMGNEVMLVDQAKQGFLAISPSEQEWNSQRGFAIQAMQNNSVLADVARRNPGTLIQAMHNCATIGLSLNPALGLAYLVTRKVNKQDKVLLDLSYKGLIDLAMTNENVEVIDVRLVHEKDEYKPGRMGEAPYHQYRAFGERGKIIGVYAGAKLNGTWIIAELGIDEVEKIRKCSIAANSKYSPWNTFYEEMVKKTAIKRLAKLLPKNPKLAIAIDYLNRDANEGIETHEKVVDELATDEQCKHIADMLSRLQRPLDAFLRYFCDKVIYRNVEELNQLTKVEAEKAENMLIQLVK